MALRLFRETGYSSILAPGETLAMHPGWLLLGVSVWVGFVCNVAIWRELAGTGRATSMEHVLALGVLLAGSSGLILSLLGWRRTVKPAAIVLLFLAAFSAASIWSQALAIDASLFSRKPSSVILPTWASLLRWQVLATLVGMGLVPSVWVVQKQVRRLPGGQQLRVNLAGAAIGAAAAAAGQVFLRSGAG